MRKAAQTVLLFFVADLILAICLKIAGIIPVIITVSHACS